jgi:hypothetical protein
MNKKLLILGHARHAKDTFADVTRADKTITGIILNIFIFNLSF